MKTAILHYNQKEYVDAVLNKALYEESEYILINYDYYNDSGICESLESQQIETLILIIHENRVLEKVLQEIGGLSFLNIFVVRLFSIDKKLDFLKSFRIQIDNTITYDSTIMDRIVPNKPYLVHLETHVVDHCNLNCKACNNFAPFVTKASNADICTFENDIRRLREMYSQIGRFFLLGGEPLLAPELCSEMIKIYRRYFPTGELRVLTNASLIMKMSDTFWSVIKNNNVIIHISLYPPIKRNIVKIEKCLSDNGVSYLIFKDIKYFLKHWTYYPFEDAEYNNKHCGSSGCHFLREGKIYKCPDSCLIGNIGDKGKKLMSNDAIDIYSSNGSVLIDKLLAPIDLCNNCTYKRSERMEWETIEETAKENDWFLKNRLEEEVDTLIKKNKEILNEMNDLAVKELKIEESYRRAVEKIKLYEALETELKNTLSMKEEDNSRIRKEAFEFREAYYQVRNSISYKVGLLLTFIPRKCAHIIFGTRLYCFREKIYKSHLIRIWKSFRNDVLHGFRVYSGLIEKYGVDTRIMYTVPNGTGDYYLCGLLLKYYICKNKNLKFVFLIPEKGGERRATQLFDTYKGHEEFYPMNKLGKDLYNHGLWGTDFFYRNDERCLIQYLHHRPAMNKWPSFGITANQLQGYNGINMVDCYKWFGFKLDDDVVMDRPLFSEKDDVYQRYFKTNTLIKNKSVLLSPYSTGLKEYELPEEFWKGVVNAFSSRGYSCVTNCFGKEKPIEGTIGMRIPYVDSVPFLELCGTFIGIRSGLCDIISTANCQKFIIHTYLAKYWPNGNSIDYTGLNCMGLCSDAIEVEYKPENGFEKILEIIANQSF